MPVMEFYTEDDDDTNGQYDTEDDYTIQFQAPAYVAESVIGDVENDI